MGKDTDKWVYVSKNKWKDVYRMDGSLCFYFFKETASKVRVRMGEGCSKSEEMRTYERLIDSKCSRIAVKY